MAGRFSVEAVFRAVDRITAPVTRMQNRVGRFTRAMSRGFNRLNRSVNKFARGVKKGALAVTAALASSSVAMLNVISTGAKFEQTLVNAATKFPNQIRKGTLEFEKLEKAARQTGKTTEFTATGAAEALNFLAQASFNAESAVAALPGVVDLATVAAVDLGTATDIASDAIGAFGLATKDPIQLGKNLARINDVLAKASTSSNTTVETLFETMKDGAPVATLAGVSLETFATLAGVMGSSTVKGSKAGTTLKNLFLSLSAPVDKASRSLKRMKINTQDADGNLRDVVDILGELDKATSKLGTAQRAGVIEGIFGKIPIAGISILLKTGSKELRRYRDSLIAATGASAQMASVMRDTVQGRINALKSAIEGVKLSIFSLTKGPLSDAIEQLTLLVRTKEPLIAKTIGEFFVNLINNFQEIVRWVKIIGKSLAVFVAFSIVLKTLIGVLLLVNLVMAANPITLIVLGVVALIAAFTALVVWIDDVAAGFDKLPGVVKLILAPIGLLIKAIKFVKDNFGLITSAASTVGNFLGFGDEEGGVAGSNQSSPLQIVSPQERVARNIEETRSTNTSEVTIRDDTGRAEITKGNFGAGLTLQPTGAF